MNKSEIFRNLARSQGLCDQWYSEWGRDLTDEELIEKALAGMHFLYHHNYPDSDMIRGLFDRDFLNEHNFYIDQEVHLLNPAFGRKTMRMLLAGSCTGEIIFTDYGIGDVFLLHDSNVTIVCQGHSRVFVNLCGNAHAKIIQEDASTVYVYHKDNATFDYTGEVKIRE